MSDKSASQKDVPQGPLCTSETSPVSCETTYEFGALRRKWEAGAAPPQRHSVPTRTGAAKNG